MPALSGETITTLRDASGNTLIAVVVFFDPATGNLRNASYTTVQDGTKTGAIIADNVTTHAITVVLTADATGKARNVRVPAHGAALTVAQLAALPSPITTVQDTNGFTLDLSGNQLAAG